MANKLFNQQSVDTARLLGESGDEATIVTDIDNYGGNTLGRDGLNIAMGNDGTLTGDTERPGINIKLVNFIKYLAKKLNPRYFQVDNWFSELSAIPDNNINQAHKATARGHLDVLSVSETATAIDVAVDSAIASDITTVKVNDQLNNWISYQGGDRRPVVQANLDVYGRSTVDAHIASAIAAQPQYLRFDNFLNEYAGQGGTAARSNLDVYSKSSCVYEINRAVNKGIIKLVNKGDSSYGTPITSTIVQSGVAIGTDIRVTDNCQSHVLLFVVSLSANRRIRLPSITDDPTLKEGGEVTIINDNTTPEGEGDLNLELTGYNIKKAGEDGNYAVISPGNGCKFIYYGGMWHPVANITTASFTHGV